MSVSAGWVSGLVATTGGGSPQGGFCLTALKAEGVKLGVMASLLGIVVLVVYHGGRSARIPRIVHCDGPDLFDGVFRARTQKQAQNLMATGRELNPTEYIGHHLTHDAPDPRRRRVLDAAPG